MNSRETSFNDHLMWSALIKLPAYWNTLKLMKSSSDLRFVLFVEYVDTEKAGQFTE